MVTGKRPITPKMGLLTGLSDDDDDDDDDHVDDDDELPRAVDMQSHGDCAPFTGEDFFYSEHRSTRAISTLSQ